MVEGEAQPQVAAEAGTCRRRRMPTVWPTGRTLHGASSSPCRVRLFRKPVRTRRGALSRRGRRMGDHLAMAGGRKSAHAAMADRLSTFARPAVLGVYLLRRVQSQLRRVQADGIGALRRAEIRQSHSRKTD